MFMKILELILSKVGESMLSRVVELTADNAVNNLKSIKDFELSVINLQKKMKSLSAKASDVEKEITNEERSGQKKRKREVEEWLGEAKAIEKEVVDLGTQVDSEGFIRRLIDGGNIAQLNEQVDQLVEQSQNFGELLLDVCRTRGVTLLTPKMVGKAFQENLERIWRLMEMGEVSCIGVHGMGGAGKTTLAKHIHNLLQEKSQVRVFWVTVSENFTIKILQEKIARCLGIELLDEDHEDVRAALLHGVLSQEKKSVVILDDVWENIDMLKVGCSVPVECCRLIITTRSLEVCRRIGCEEVIAVEKLDEDEAWNLFIETLGKSTKLGPQVEEIAKSVARMCDGLPLGIVTLAGSMRDETEIHIWRSALEELKKPVTGQDITGGVEIFEVLKYSFDQLNRNHQRQSNEEFNLFQSCFLYCSLYPEDHKIRRGELVGRFISEGLLDRSSRRAQLDLGDSILDKLVKVCLLESCVDDSGNKCVKMHDLIRGMALKIVEGKYMVRAGDESMKEIPMEEEWTKDLEKASLMNNWIVNISEGTSPNCPKLSTLLLQGNLPLEVIPDSFLSKLQGLSTLNLGSTHIKMLPNSLSELTSLKALLLENCSLLEKVPNLGKLKALRELNLSGTAIKEIPRGVEELLNLKFLSICLARQLEVLRRGLLFKLVHLQYVMFPFHIAAPIEGIEKLKQLEEFRGRVNDMADFKCFITSRVRETSYRIIVGSWCGQYYMFDYEFKRSVVLVQCSLKHEIVLGEDIEEIMIVKCHCESNCLLDGISGIECIWKRQQQLMRLPQGFPSQTQLRASSQVAFSSVKVLHVFGCNRITKLGLPVLALPNIETIMIDWCDKMEEIFEDEVRGHVTLPKLHTMRLSHVPRVKSVCMAPIISNSIYHIKIVGCPRLKKLPLLFDVSPPPSLNDISVERKWWESLEWDNPDLPHRLQPFLIFG